MNKLKSIIKQVIHSDPLTFNNKDPPLSDYLSIVIHFQNSSPQKRIDFRSNLFQKLNRAKQVGQILRLLIICDMLTDREESLYVSFPNTLFNHLNETGDHKNKWIKHKQEKKMLAQKNFALFYLSYLKQKSWGESCKGHTPNLYDLDQCLTYCFQAINSLKLIIKYDFVIDFMILHEFNKSKVQIIIRNVLKRSSENFFFFIEFLQKWNNLIMEQKERGVEVNEVYEQFIFLNKNIWKWELFTKKANLNFQFPKFKIDKVLNSKIQNSMMGKQKERKQISYNRILRTQASREQPRWNKEQSQNFETKQEITQSELYMNFKF